MRITADTMMTIHYPAHGSARPTPTTGRARHLRSYLGPEWQTAQGPHPLHMGHLGISFLAIGSVGAYLAILPDASTEIL